MDHKEFNEVLAKRIADLHETLSIKSAEYSSNSDKLENFKDAAAMTGETPEKAQWGMVVKHIIALQKFIYQVEENQVSYKQWNEKIGDIICYAVLLDALIQERGIE